MLRLPPFEYVRAESPRHAAQVMAERAGDAMLLAGGTDLLPNLKRRQFDAPVLVAIGHLESLRTLSANGELSIGAGVRLDALARHAAVQGAASGLVQAVRQIANPQIQRQGTIGGNLCVDTRCNYYNQTHEWRESIGFCMKREGDVCLVAPGSSKCWAVSSSDAAPMLIALDARVVLEGPDGDRDIPLAALYQDDGIEYLTRRPEELISKVLVPLRPDVRSTYRKVRRRGSFDFPILGVALALRFDGGEVREARLALSGVHTHPVVVDVDAVLEGRALGSDRIDEVADAAYKAATPLDNVDLMYHWRKKMVRVEVRRAFEDLLGE